MKFFQRLCYKNNTIINKYYPRYFVKLYCYAYLTPRNKLVYLVFFNEIPKILLYFKYKLIYVFKIKTLFLSKS